MWVMHSWMRSVAASVVLVGLLASALTTCVAAATTDDEQQMACCKTSDHPCGQVGSAADCCTVAEPPQSQIVALRPFPLQAPQIVIAHMTNGALVLLSTARQVFFRPAPIPRTALGPPPCIAFSTLLI